MTHARKVSKSFGWFLFSDRCKHVLEKAYGWLFFKLYFRVRRADHLGDTPPSMCGLKMFGGEVIRLYVFSKANYWQVVGDII